MMEVIHRVHACWPSTLPLSYIPSPTLCKLLQKQHKKWVREPTPQVTMSNLGLIKFSFAIE